MDLRVSVRFTRHRVHQCLLSNLHSGLALHQFLPVRRDLSYPSARRLDNYREALTKDPIFWSALRNTTLYVIGVVPSITILGFALALAGHSVRYAKSFFRTIYFLPSITPMVVIALIWVWLYSPRGMFNQILASIGIQGPNWLFEKNLALPSVIIMSVWQTVGYYTVLYLAGLADIPKDFYDAANVDGANWWQTIRHVTVPLLNNVTLFVTVTLAIAAFQVFTQVYVMTRGGPGNATTTIQFLIFRQPSTSAWVTPRPSLGCSSS